MDQRPQSDVPSAYIALQLYAFDAEPQKRRPSIKHETQLQLAA